LFYWEGLPDNCHRLATVVVVGNAIIPAPMSRTLPGGNNSPVTASAESGKVVFHLTCVSVLMYRILPRRDEKFTARVRPEFVIAHHGPPVGISMLLETGILFPGLSICWMAKHNSVLARQHEIVQCTYLHFDTHNPHR